MPMKTQQTNDNNKDDVGVENWKRVRSQIEHENTLINHRLSWLFSSQGFLFGAFIYIFQFTIKGSQAIASAAQQGQVFVDIPRIQLALVGIAIVGISICVFILVMLTAAHKQIHLLEDWWAYHHLNNLNNPRDIYKIELLKEHPPINGLFDERLYRALCARWLPYTLIIGWGILIYVILYDFTLKIDKNIIWTIGVTLIIIIFIRPIYGFLLNKKT